MKARMDILGSTHEWVSSLNVLMEEYLDDWEYVSSYSIKFLFLFREKILAFSFLIRKFAWMKFFVIFQRDLLSFKEWEEEDMDIKNK